jgi:hypothetical protein
MLYSLSSNAQSFTLDTLFVGKERYDYIRLSAVDSNYVLRTSNNRRQGRDNTYIIKPSSVDTLNIRTSQIPIHFGEHLFFDYNYSEKNRPAWSQSNVLEYFNYDNRFYSDLGGEFVVIISGSSEADYSIDFFNPITREIKPLIKFQDLSLPTLPSHTFDGDWGVSRPFIIDEKKAILEIVYSDVSGFTYFYFKNKNGIKLITELLEGATSISENTIISIDRKSIAFRINYREGVELNTKSILFTANIEPVGEILLRNTPTGLNMKKGKFSGYFLSAHLDNDFYAAFYYELNPTLELAMYKAFHNGILTQQDIKGLSKKELGILRNLLFAKHNYQFDSLYYQAYFKTLDFYVQLGRDSRTKNINHLLTEVDKANIALIRAAEARVKE